MTITTAMPDVSETMTRAISLSLPADEAQVALMAEGEGVLSAMVSQDRKTLRLVYDVRRTGMAALERLAVTVGLNLSARPLARIARAWATFQDENLREQARIVHHCCNTPPQA